MAKLTINSQNFYTQTKEELLKEVNVKNPFGFAEIEKISINVGIGKNDPKQKTDIAQYLKNLTGQTPKTVESRASIAGFNLRKGMVVGLVTTLRGKKMKDFLINLIYIALPRSRDFKGVKASFDRAGRVYSLGLDNTGIFPIIGFDTSVNFGMQINIVFKNNSEYNKLLLTKLGFPFKKD
jgi:large subunit ribosomal protein L5